MELSVEALDREPDPFGCVPVVSLAELRLELSLQLLDAASVTRVADALLHIQDVFEHGSGELPTADLAVARDDDGRVQMVDRLEHRDPATPADVRVLRREPWEDREEPVLHEVACEQDAVFAHEDELVPPGVSEPVV